MARRGENIRKRKDGRWEGRYIKARTSEGKIQWGYVYGTVYAEVKRVLIQKKAEAGFYSLKRTDLTFEALAEVWLHSLKNAIMGSTARSGLSVRWAASTPWSSTASAGITPPSSRVGGGTFIPSTPPTTASAGKTHCR